LFIYLFIHVLDWKALFVKLFTTRFVEFPLEKTKGLMSVLKIGFQVHCSSILQGKKHTNIKKQNIKEKK
jgi:hypothetical protein